MGNMLNWKPKFLKRLKKSTPEMEQEFSDRFKEAGVSLKDKIAMVLSAYLVLLLPSFLILVVLSLLAMWIFGAL